MAHKLRVIFFGRNQKYSLRVLARLRAHHQVVGIVESRPRGDQGPSAARALADRLRRRPSLGQVARAAGIPGFVLTRERTEPLREFLAALQPDVGAICSMAQLLPPAIIGLFPRGVLNLHPSLLPRYRGPSPTFWEFWHQEPEGGVTVHFIDAGEDTGDIVGQARVPIPFGADGDAHFTRCHDEGARLLIAALDRLEHGPIQTTPQRHLPCPFRARYVGPADSPLDWTSTPIEQVFHLLRGMLPFMDLLPRPPLPWALVKWRAASFQRGSPRAAPGRYFFQGGRVAIAHAQGHVWLTPRLAPGHAARLLRDLIAGGAGATPRPG